MEQAPSFEVAKAEIYLLIDHLAARCDWHAAWNEHMNDTWEDHAHKLRGIKHARAHAFGHEAEFGTIDKQALCPFYQSGIINIEGDWPMRDVYGIRNEWDTYWCVRLNLQPESHGILWPT
jgi:hypothetical protein